ncbi:MAG: response regulator [Chitinophagaceae bacterium]
MDEGRNIMIIDDEADLCMLMKNYLQHRQYNVHYALTLTDGLEQLKTFQPDFLFLDNNLPDGPGWTKARELTDAYPNMRLYLMSGYQPSPPHDIPEERYRLLHKPISFNDLDFLRPPES